MFSKIIATIIAGLGVAAIIALIKSRWLYVIIPKLYLNTPLSDGQVVTLEIFNAGLTAEEDVAINMRPSCQFEVIATSKSTINHSGHRISIAKISRRETITIHLLIEGKDFHQNDIESVESKSTKAKIVDSKEKAVAIWQYLLALPAFLFLLVIPFWGGTFVGYEMKYPIHDYVAYKLDLTGQTKQLSDYKNTIKEKYGFDDTKNLIRNKKVEIKITEIVRKGNILNVDFEVQNNLKVPLFGDVFIDSPAGDGPLFYDKTRVDNLSVASNQSQKAHIQAYLPEETEVKFLKLTYSLNRTDGDRALIVQILEF